MMYSPKELRERFWQKDAMNGEIIKKQYEEIKRVNKEKSLEWTKQQFINVKQYAIEHTQYYKDFHATDSFPILSKMDFINNSSSIRSNEIFSMPIHTSSTSGSTGTPFTVEQNYEKRMRTIADLKVFGEYADYPSHEKMLQLRAYNGIALDREKDKSENIWRYDVSNLDDVNMEHLVEFINEWRPRIIFGYVSTLELIANYLISKKVNYDFGCKSVLVGAETLTEEIAYKIKSVFNCPIYDRYSNMEMGIYAQREFGKSNFKVNKASYYIEIMKIDSDELAEENEIGRIVVTDLFNRRFPMIRYDTGDIGSFCINKGEWELNCVYGRKVDCIYSSTGVIVDPHVISRLMSEEKNIVQWQFIQHEKMLYEFRIKCIDEIGESRIEKNVKKILGDDAELKFNYVDDIPVMSSQKRKYIINNYKKAD